MWRISDNDSDASDEGDASGELNTSEHKRKQRRTNDDPNVSPRGHKRRKRSRSLDSTGGDDSGRERQKRRRSGSFSEFEPALDEDDARRRRSPSQGRKRKRSTSPEALDFTASFLQEEHGAMGYRAVRQEHVASGLSQDPCVRCPTYDFCKDDGPVNPQECLYYDMWLVPQEQAYRDAVAIH